MLMQKIRKEVHCTYCGRQARKQDKMVLLRHVAEYKINIQARSCFSSGCQEGRWVLMVYCTPQIQTPGQNR